MSLGAIEDTRERRHHSATSRRRSYTEREKATALEVLAANGGQLRRTAEQLGIAPVTLLDWQRQAEKGPQDDGIELLRPLIRRVLDEECEAAAREFIAAARLPEKVEKAGTLQLMTSAGIAIDKMRLLREQATAIHAQQMSDEERLARLDELLQTALTLPEQPALEQHTEEQEHADEEQCAPAADDDAAPCS